MRVRRADGSAGAVAGWRGGQLGLVSAGLCASCPTIHCCAPMARPNGRAMRVARCCEWMVEAQLYVGLDAGPWGAPWLRTAWDALLARPARTIPNGGFAVTKNSIRSFDWARWQPHRRWRGPRRRPACRHAHRPLECEIPALGGLTPDSPIARQRAPYAPGEGGDRHPTRQSIATRGPGGGRPSQPGLNLPVLGLTAQEAASIRIPLATLQNIANILDQWRQAAASTRIPNLPIVFLIANGFR
jgi:hypothetical protein